MAPRTSFLSRQRDVIAYFSFGAWSVQTCFQQRNIFEVLQRTLPFYYVHPLGGGHIIFAFSAIRCPGVRRPTWFPDILGNSSYPIFTKFGMQVYSVNSLYGIAFGDDSSIAN